VSRPGRLNRIHPLSSGWTINEEEFKLKTYTITIFLDNDAFRPEHGNKELSKILRRIADRAEEGITPPLLRLQDTDGNYFGETSLNNEN
jgi:hypothetical protein